MDQKKIEMAIAQFKAMHECNFKEISGCSKNCDDCELNYRQGTQREVRENIELAISALETVAKIPEVITELEQRYNSEKQQIKEYCSAVWCSGFCCCLEIVKEKLCGGGKC